MESRYNRPSSPRSRMTNPARSSTGTFANPSYYDSSYYVRPSSPRTSGDRIPGSLHQTYYAPSSSSHSRTSSLKYDSYSGRPRRNTDDRMARPDINNIIPASTSVIPIRTHTSHAHRVEYDRPSSPLASSWNNRGDTYITHGPSRREHKKYYSVDDNSHSAKLVAEKEIIEPRRQDSSDHRGYSVTTGGRSYYHQQPHARQTDLNDEGYSYTDAAGMYRDTEPAWRRPRSGSMERSSRPTSMIMERAPRSSARELGPPPSMRGFDKIKPPRSSSIDRSREIPKYDPYPEAPNRTSSTRHYSPAIHQEPRDNRRDTFHEGYDRRDRDLENRRYPTTDRFEDRDVASRGFGIAPGLTQEPHPVDRQPVWNTGDVARSRPDDYGTQYRTTDRVDNRVPEARMPEPRIPREREPVSNYSHSNTVSNNQYEERPRERDNNRRDSSNVAPIVAGAVTGAAATVGAAEYLKSRDRERERDRDRDRERGERPREQISDRDRERRKEYDERERRDRAPDERVEERRERERVPEDRLPPAAAAYASTQDADRHSYDRRYEEDDRDRRSSRKPPSPEGSGDERPRHYVDRDVERRAAETALKEAPLDPDEEYRRRIEQEAQRNGRRDRDNNDTDRERERQRRKEERNMSRDVPPSNVAEPPRSRYDDRSNSVFDNAIVQEPESLEQSNKNVQIVTPPKEPAAPLKGILRKPTAKFPEDPDPIREGVAPHKSMNKGKDIPQGARWTRIDRRLVNPEALEEAGERFEERMDCVIVLRVLAKEEIQKLADRTKAIREKREDEYERRDRKERDRGGYRDDEDRDRGRRREYDDYDDLERDRERERDRPRMIESGR